MFSWLSFEYKIAEVFDQDNLDPIRARDSFVRAGDWYKQEEANACVVHFGSLDSPFPVSLTFVF